MAFQCSENLDDGELWLPSDFLSDESPPKEGAVVKTQWSSKGFILDSSYNSPVESIVGSTETESDEEDEYMAGLAQRIAHSMLEDNENNSRREQQLLGKSNNTMARSPQSTLCAVGRWSSMGPPPQMHHGQGCRETLQTRSCSFSGFPSKDRVNTFRRSWTDKPTEEDKKIPSHQYANNRNVFGWGWGKQAQQSRSNRCLRPVEYYPSPPWPPAGAGMRAVFLGSSGSARESGGTGVFLPRRMGTNSNLRKKPACSTVLLPSRIVEALNLNLEHISSQPNLQCSLSHVHRDILESMPAATPPATIHHGGRPNDHYKSVVRNGLSEQQKKLCDPVRPRNQAVSSEICLPQEWTY